MPVQHLLKQVEIHRANRHDRDVRPDWITKFVDDAAEFFEPVAGVGRVGFECQLTEDGWEIGLYLGSTEIVGGKNDGQARHPQFDFDLLGLLARFTDVDRFRWNAHSNSDCGDDAPGCAQIVVEGQVDTNPLRVKILSTPPQEAGPGFRQFPDGRQETV